MLMAVARVSFRRGVASAGDTGTTVQGSYGLLIASAYPAHVLAMAECDRADVGELR